MLKNIYFYTFHCNNDEGRRQIVVISLDLTPQNTPSIYVYVLKLSYLCIILKRWMLDLLKLTVVRESYA